MKWTRGYRSDQVEDRRGEGGGLSMGGVGLLYWLFKLFGLPGLLIGGALLFFGSGLLGDHDSSSESGSQGVAGEQGDGSDFVSFVFDDVQKTWSDLFQADGTPYRLARLVLFTRRIGSACGLGQAAMGPFYCPRDEKVYIDLSFYRELKDRLGAPGDFAQAYVIAHEMGHHVQHLRGLDRKVEQAARGEQVGSGALSVRLELQADCLAGVWAHSSEQRQLLEQGDIEEALNAAAAIGDDRLQKESEGTVSPETWTHGSSQQRVRWFRRGYEVGTIAGCDTFGASKL